MSAVKLSGNVNEQLVETSEPVDKSFNLFDALCLGWLFSPTCLFMQALLTAGRLP